MPVAAKFAAVSGALAFDAGQQSGIEGVTLGTITPLAAAPMLSVLLGGLFHAGQSGCRDDDLCTNLYLGIGSV